MIAKKDQELQKFRNINSIQKRGLSHLRFESPSPRRHSLGGASPNAPRRRQGSGSLGITTSDSADERRHQNESRPSSSKFSGEAKDNNISNDIELLGLEDSVFEKRFSDSCLSMGTDTDGSISSGAMELTLFPETSNPSEMFKQSEQNEK